MTYCPPVERLVTLGQPEWGPKWRDYSELGLGPEHIADLVRIVEQGDLSGDSEGAESWAPVHAWRALAQFRAPEVVAPMLAVLEDEQDDWAHNDAPWVFGAVGAPAVRPLTALLHNGISDSSLRVVAGEALARIGAAHPDARLECAAALSLQMQRFEEEDGLFNGFVLAGLVDLKAVEALPLIRAAFEAGAVDPSVSGDLEDVEIELGVREERETPRPRYHGPLGFPPDPTPPDRRREAKRKKNRRKAAKASRRRNRR